MLNSRVSKLIGIAVLVAVAIVAVPVVVLAVAPMAYSGLIERYVRSNAGIDLSMQRFAVTLHPLEIEVSGLVLRNPDPAFEEPLLAAQRLRAHIHLGRYLNDAPTWWRGVATGIDVRLERDALGNTNWDLIDDDEPAEPPRENALLQFDAVRIDDLTLLVVVPEEQHRFEVSRLELDKDVHERLRVDLAGRHGDEPLIASGILALPHPQRASEVAFDATVFGGELSVAGVIGHDGVAPGEARFRVAFDDLSSVGVLLGADLAALEPLVLEGRLGAPEPGHWQIDTAGELAGHPLDVEGVLVPPGDSQAGEVWLRAIAVDGELSVDGVIGPDELAPGRARFHVAFDDLLAIGALLGEDLSRWQPIDLRGEVATPEPGRWQLSTEGRLAGEPVDVTGALVQPEGARDGEVTVRGRLFGGEVDVAVSVDDDRRLRQARFRVAYADLSSIAALLDDDFGGFEPLELRGEIATPAPDRWHVTTQGRLAGQPLDLTAALALADDRYRLHDLDLSFGDSALQATGELALEEKRVSGRVRAERLDIDRLPLDRWLDEPTDAPLELHGLAASLPVDELGRWSIDVGVEVGRLDYAGTQLTGLELELDAPDAALDFDLRLAALRRDNGERAWALVEPSRLAGRVSRAERAPGAPRVEMRFATAGIAGDLAAELPIREHDALEFDLRAEVTGFEAFDGVELARFEPLLPFAADLHAVRDGTTWRIDPLDMTVAGEPARGRLIVDPAAEPMLIRGDLHARNLDLRRLIDVEEVVEEVQVEAEDAEARDVPLFADDPLDWGWLDAAVVDVRARVDRLVIRPVTLRDARAQVRLRDGVLVVDPVLAELANGGIRSRLRMRRHDGGGEFDVRVLATGLTPADLGVEDEMIRGGASALFVDLQSRGQSAQALAAALSGELAVEVRQTVIETEMIDVLGADVVAELIRNINPFVEREERTELECAAAHVVAVDGVLVSSDHIVLETTNVTVRASAVVDLREETLEINFEPEARDGVDIGIADVADLVQVRGSITAPEIELDPAGVVGAVATAGAAVATAGVSLLVQALFEDDENGTPCRAVFAATPADHDAEDLEDAAAD